MTNPTDSVLLAVFGKSPEIGRDLLFPQGRVRKEVILRLAIRRQNGPQTQGVVQENPPRVGLDALRQRLQLGGIHGAQVVLSGRALRPGQVDNAVHPAGVGVVQVRRAHVGGFGFDHGNGQVAQVGLVLGELDFAAFAADLLLGVAEETLDVDALDDGWEVPAGCGGEVDG